MLDPLRQGSCKSNMARILGNYSYLTLLLRIRRSHHLMSNSGYSVISVCISPVHVEEKQVIPSNEVETNSSSAQRNQHHLCQNKRKQCCVNFTGYSNINNVLGFKEIYSVRLTCGPLELVLNSSTRSMRCLGLTVPSMIPYLSPILCRWTATIRSMLVHWDTITLQDTRGDVISASQVRIHITYLYMWHSYSRKWWWWFLIR